MYHRGPHTWSIKLGVVHNDDPKTEAIQENVDFGPTGIVKRKLMNVVQQQAGMGDVDHLAKKLSNKPRMKQGMMYY